MNMSIFFTNKPLVLASASPRRRQFLSSLGLQFTVFPAEIDETPMLGETPAAFARRMAMEKAEAVARLRPESWVIGADTVVTIDGEIIGKPADAAHALETLRKLRGRTHEVITGLSLSCVQERCAESLAETTQVTFADFPDTVLAAYVRTGEPLDKAGAYGIQAGGAFLVSELRGSCSSVIGLPLHRCVDLLLRHGVISPQL